MPDVSPCLLSLDTATETLHLGLVRAGREWVQALPGGAQASETLMPGLQALLAEAGCPLSDLQAIAFGRGPGAFTGLRTACALAQGLALGLGLPVIPIDTLLAVAESARRSGAGATVCAAQDARMGQIYAAVYRQAADGAWSTLSEPALLHPPALIAALQAWPEAELAGNALEVHAPALAALDHRRWPQAQPDGAALLALARRAWAAGEGIDPALALPLYVRDKVAETTAERAAAQARVLQGAR